MSRSLSSRTSPVLVVPARVARDRDEIERDAAGMARARSDEEDERALEHGHDVERLVGGVVASICAAS